MAAEQPTVSVRTKECPPHSGLNDYSFRFYSPGLGRWINRDPIGESGGLNLYDFVENDPVNIGDSYGLSPWSKVPKEIAKRSAKAALKKYLNKVVKRQITRLSDKALRKKFYGEMQDILGAFEADSFWSAAGEFLIDILPGVGEAKLVFRDIPAYARALERAQDLNRRVELALNTRRRAVAAARTLADAAKKLGYNRRIPPQRAPFNSHGQTVFCNGNTYITRDVDSHIGGAWKMFDRRGRRIGTYDENLNWIGD